VSDTPNNQASPDAAKGHLDEDVAAIIGSTPAAIPQSAPANAKHHRSTKKRRWTNDPAMFWITLAGVIAVVAYTSVAAWQGRLMSDQLNVMRGQLNAMAFDERPWLALDVSIGGPLVHDAVGSSNGVTWHVPLAYRIKNLGKTPAIDVALFAHILPMVGGKEGINFSEELDKACDFPEKMLTVGLGWGETIFPQEEWPEKTFRVTGTENIFEKAKRADPQQNSTRYYGEFLVAPCVTYKSTFSSEAPFRTAKEYLISKRTGAPIDLEGETLNPAELHFIPNRTHGSLAK
jgi:hypothetical protein